MYRDELFWSCLNFIEVCQTLILKITLSLSSIRVKIWLLSHIQRILMNALYPLIETDGELRRIHFAHNNNFASRNNVGSPNGLYYPGSCRVKSRCFPHLLSKYIHTHTLFLSFSLFALVHNSPAFLVFLENAWESKPRARQRGSMRGLIIDPQSGFPSKLMARASAFEHAAVLRLTFCSTVRPNRLRRNRDWSTIIGLRRWITPRDCVSVKKICFKMEKGRQRDRREREREGGGWRENLSSHVKVPLRGRWHIDGHVRFDFTIRSLSSDVRQYSPWNYHNAAPAATLYFVAVNRARQRPSNELIFEVGNGRGLIEDAFCI